jgi:peptidyl-prolyl cis-trans isomerase D
MAMMTSIRNRSHVFLWALLFLFLLSMSVGGLVGGANIIDQLLGRVNPAEAIGSVNGDKITPDQFNQAVTARLRAIQDSGTEISDQYLETIRQQVWNAFIEERLTKQAIEDLDIKVSDDEILYHLRNNPPFDIQQIFFRNNVFDKDYYMQALNTPGMIDWAPIEAWMRDFYLPRYKLQQIIKMSAVVNDVEVKEEYIRRNIDYTISALHVPKNSIQDRVIKPGEKELKNEYKNRIDEFEELEKRHISFVSWPKTASLEDTNRTKQEAFEIIENYKNGTDFSVLANIHTQDPGNQIAPDSGRGGDLGWFEKGQMVKSFEDAAFKGRRGSVVGPVLSQFGYHIIKIDSIKNRGKNNHQVKARHILLKVELGQKTRSELRRKATLFSYDAQDYGLSSAIDTHSVNIQQAENLKENDFFISQVGPFRSAVRWVFNSKIDDISDPLETESYYAVFKLDSITPAGVEDFDNVKDKIYRDLISENEFDATNLYAEEIKTEILNGSSFKSIKEENNRLELVPSDKKSLNSSFISLGRSEQLVGALINSKKGDIVGPIKTARGHGIVKVIEIEKFDSTNWVSTKTNIRTDLANKKEREVYSDWMQSLKDEAEIIDNRKFHF